MTRRTMRIILAAVAVLAAAYGATLLAGGSGGPADGAAVRRALGAVARAGLDSVRVAGRAGTLALRRQDDGWRVGGWLADSADVAGLEEALAGDVPLELASRNPSNHPRMGVDSVSARRVLLASGEGESTRLLLGDGGPYASSAYVRLPGSDDVFLIRGELPRLLRQGPSAWRERTLVRLDTARVAVLRLRRSGRTYELRRGDGGWRVDGERADSARVRTALSRLDGLSATGFAPDTARPGQVERSVAALSSGGDTLAALRMERTGPEGAPGFRVEARGREGLFELTATEADRVVPAREELTAPAGGNRQDGGSPGPGG